MKKSLIIMALLLVFFGAVAIAGGESTSYVKTGDHVFFGQNLKKGLFNTKIISSDGTVTKIPNRDVVSYMHNSRLFENLPVIGESNGILGHSMMEYITTKSGLNLYRYDCPNGLDTKSCYFVFKDGKFYLRVDPKNAMTVLPFFGITNITIN
jgi:hypothetical protein